MTTTLLFLLFALLLIFLNAFFVLAEFAFVKARPTQIEALADRGHRQARLVQYIQTNLDKFLNVCQIGITLASIGLGFVGEPALAKLFTPPLHALGLDQSAVITAHGVAIALSYLLISFLHIVIGEQVPKILAIRQTERAALYTAYPLYVLYHFFYAPLWLLNSSVNAVLKICRVKPVHGEAEHSDDEVRIILNHSQSSGLMSFRRLLYIENVLDMGTLVVRNAMQRRPRVQVLRLDAPAGENEAVITRYRHSRYPVLAPDGETPAGFVHLKDLLLARLAGQETANLAPFLRPCLKVRESDALENVLSEMQRKGMHLALASNETGVWTGIITLEDILEEVVGTIEDEYPTEPPIRLKHALHSAELVIPNVEGETIVAAAHHALARVTPGLLPLAVTEIIPHIAERERTGSSYVGRSLAIPHARLKNINQPLVVFARLKKPIAAPTSFSEDVIRYLFILLTPASAPRQHQILLSRIAGIFESGYLDAHLEKATTARELYDAIVEVEQATDMPG
jgi:CBS domain containing-hemolysin-like protein/mannitol/fructose-specific phosphotransferase system IIA component (Ntr-type)